MAATRDSDPQAKLPDGPTWGCTSAVAIDRDGESDSSSDPHLGARDGQSGTGRLWPRAARRARFHSDRLIDSFPLFCRMSFCRLVRSPMLVIARAARLAAVATVVSALPAALGAQPFVPQRSTVDGVFTAAQAKRGADVYNMLCQSCHSAESHTGTPFRNNWVGKTLAELFGYISSEMPKTEPGSLSPEEYTLVLAYILRMNGMPAGRRTLTADASQLDSIRIDLPKRAALSTSRDR